MSTCLFYLLLVVLSDNVEFSFIWLAVSGAVGFVMSGAEVKYKYRYTSDPALDGKDVEDAEDIESILSEAESTLSEASQDKSNQQPFTDAE